MIVILSAVTDLLFAAPARAQDSIQHSICRDPHPAPTCGSYLLFEYMGAVRIVGTQITTTRETRDALRSWFAWDLGWMKNQSPIRTLGASLSIGGSADGSRIALKARGRQWLDHNLVFDASAGPMVTALQNGGTEGQSSTFGATADLGIGRARLGLLTLSGDVAQQRGRTRFAVHAGARTESRGVAIVTIASIVGVLALLAAIGAAGGGQADIY